MSQLRMFETDRFVRFVLTGGFAAAINVASRWVFSFAMPYELAVTFAYLVGMLTAFILSRSFVFERSSSPVAQQFSRFALVNAVAFCQVWLVSVGLDRLLFPIIGFVWHAETVAHIAGVSSPVITSYFAHRRYSFN